VGLDGLDLIPLQVIELGSFELVWRLRRMMIALCLLCCLKRWKVNRVRQIKNGALIVIWSGPWLRIAAPGGGREQVTDRRRSRFVVLRLVPFGVLHFL